MLVPDRGNPGVRVGDPPERAKSWSSAAATSASLLSLGCSMSALASPPTTMGPAGAGRPRSSVSTASCWPGGR
eukprot:10276729-Lingulodinium_polyedra.AAC.1